jgi:hypothetical protein
VKYMSHFDALLEIGGRKTWEMPHLTGINKLPPHATTIPFPSPLFAMSREREASPWFHSLNGFWDFKLAPRPGDVKDDYAGIRTSTLYERCHAISKYSA